MALLWLRSTAFLLLPRTSAFFGWASAVTQSGRTLDHTQWTPGGARGMKHRLLISVAPTIQRREREGAELYGPLIKARCPYGCVAQ